MKEPKMRARRGRDAATTPRPVRVLAMLLVPVIAFAIASCDSGQSARAPYAGIPEGRPTFLSAPVPDPKEVVETKTAGKLPDFLVKLTGPAKDRVTALYQGAMDHYQDFGYIPCYCGCASYTTPHHSLAECYIKAKGQDGTLTFTDHSTSCDICEGVARQTLDGIAANKPLGDIRAEVFTNFKYTGIWTDTPPVP